MNECCKLNENLVLADGESAKSDLIVRICKVCHKRHFELSVDKAELFGTLKG